MASLPRGWERCEYTSNPRRRECPCQPSPRDRSVSWITPRLCSRRGMLWGSQKGGRRRVLLEMPWALACDGPGAVRPGYGGGIHAQPSEPHLARDGAVCRARGERTIQLLGVHQRDIDQVFRQKPDLHFVHAEDVTDQQIVRPIVACRGRLPGRLANLLNDDLMRFQQA
jgi:hypothetical protein